MRTKFLYIIVLLCLFFIARNGTAQNAKKFFKLGNEYNNLGNYELAIEQYTKAIDLDQKFTKALEARALAYEELSDYKNAAEDFETLNELSPKEYNYGLKAANLFFRVGEYKRSLGLAASIEPYAKELPELSSIKAKCLFALEDYSAALEAANKAVRLNGSSENYFLRGLIQAAMVNYAEAVQDFEESAKLKPDFTDALVQQSLMLYKLNKKNEALITLKNVIDKGGKNKKAYLLRSKIYSENGDYKSAIADLTSAISISPDIDLFIERADAYFLSKLYNEAINDYSIVIQKEKNNIKALENRAICYQSLNKKAEAAKDYNQIISKLNKTENNKEIIERIQKSQFELQRESNRPSIIALNPDFSEIKSLDIVDGIDIIPIRVKITDENDIINISVNNKPIKFNPDSIQTGQLLDINMQGLANFEILAEDIYKNKSKVLIKITRRDEGLPKITLTEPITTEAGSIFLRTLDSDVVIEGRVLGKNLIDSIKINNTPIVFDNTAKNPSFKQRIKVTDLDNLTFLVKDDKGNKVQKNFFIDRSDVALLNDNPMGRTWVVFVENSEYSSFTDLEGPKKEVDLMIKALSKYKIDKIIHKKNLTKSQMNFFFTQELKQMVNENRVNSLLIWYAGHGKLVEQSGFWIPVDSKIDDVATYYNINTLKTSLKPYVQNITHSLIITDACETGPSFYMSMRNLSSDRNCSDSKSTKSKSSQLFSSSNKDYDDGDSQFTMSFANALMFDSNSCIPIERIVNKVSTDVLKSKKSRPIFGRITGFEDENGTFIFIKK